MGRNNHEIKVRHTTVIKLQNGELVETLPGQPLTVPQEPFNPPPSPPIKQPPIYPFFPDESQFHTTHTENAQAPQVDIPDPTDYELSLIEKSMEQNPRLNRARLPFLHERVLTEDENAPLDALSLYLRQIKPFPRLSAEEEKKYAIKNDQESQASLIEANLYLAVEVARNYSNFRFPLIDLIQEGNVGLIYFVQNNKFDPNKNYKFATPAVYYIRWKILDYLEKERRTRYVKYSPGFLLNMGKLNQSESYLSQKLFHEPTIQELSIDTGLPDWLIVELRKAAKGMLSLDYELSPSNSDEDEVTIVDSYEGPNGTELPETVLLNNEKKEKVKNVIKHLTHLQRKAVALSFHLYDGISPTHDNSDRMPPTEIARIMGKNNRQAAEGLVNSGLKNLRRFQLDNNPDTNLKEYK